MGARDGPDGPHGFSWIFDWLGQNLDPGTRPQRSGYVTGASADAPVPIRLEVVDAQRLLLSQLKHWLDVVISEYPLTRLAGPDVHTASAMTGWMLANIRLVQGTPFVVLMLNDLEELERVAHGVAPWRAGGRRLPGVPCPWCHATALTIPGGEIDVKCGHCGAWIEHDRFQMWARYLAESARKDNDDGSDSGSG